MRARPVIRRLPLPPRPSRWWLLREMAVPLVLTIGVVFAAAALVGLGWLAWDVLRP